MSKTVEVELPSGKKVELRETTFAHAAMVEEWSNNGAGMGVAAIRLQCCLLVPQRTGYWSGDEVTDPNAIEYDLSIKDGGFLQRYLIDQINGEVADSDLPLSEETTA